LKDIDFRFPLTLTLMTLVFCSGTCWLYVWVTGATLKHADTMTLDFFVRRICPIGALSAGTIVMGMASYLFLTVAFVQMLKAFTPVMTMGGMAMFGLQNPSTQGVVCVVVICAGTALAGYGELNFHLVGFACMLLAQVFEALKLIFTQIVLQNLKFDLLETLYYITPASAVFVLIFALPLEFAKMSASDLAIISEHAFAFVLSCLFAVLTNIINTFVIQFTNALVLKLVATARNAMLVLATAFMGEPVTLLQGLGYSISLAGFFAYTFLEHRKKP
jgi:hypothetical protein